MSPLIALSTYICHGCSASARNSNSTTIVHSAALRSHASIVRRLSQRSLSAPANMLITTYGAYEHIDSIAVSSAEPLR